MAPRNHLYLNGPEPLRVTLKVAVPVSKTVREAGPVTMAGLIRTLTAADLLVALPTSLETTTL